jgi:hypothetical protein
VFFVVPALNSCLHRDKLDGVDQLNNIMVIGMTNRLDMIDEALLRPGRLEVHMEISLPDEKGRYQILNIHTYKMQTNGVLDDDVDLVELASLTKNFSGAEITGLIKSATSFAFNRHVKVGTMAGISDDVENLRVNRDDFMRALSEVHPAFGVSEEELQQVIQNGIIHYSHNVDVSSMYFATFSFNDSLEGIAEDWQPLCRTSTDIDTNAPCQHIASRATWIGKDRTGSINSPSIWISIHQTTLT